MVMPSTVKSLIAMGTDDNDEHIQCEEDDVISGGDITGAFLVVDESTSMV